MLWLLSRKNMGKPQYVDLLCNALVECKDDKSVFFLFVGRGTERHKLKKTIILTTHKTMSKDFFIEKINEINADLLLIADEMHHLASENYSKGLIDNYNYRLGLSATPSKFMDENSVIYT